MGSGLALDQALAIHIFKPRATAALNCQLGVVTLTGRRFGYLDGVPYVEVDSGEYVTNESAGTTTVILHHYSAVIRRVEAGRLRLTPDQRRPSPSSLCATATSSPGSTPCPPTGTPTPPWPSSNRTPVRCCAWT